MPKSQKPLLVLFMSEYAALPAGRWVDVKLVNILPGDGLLTLVFEVLGRPDQLGRQIEYTLPALLAPASPLAGWLSAALGIHLNKGESIDLEQLTGRVAQAMFAKPSPDGTQVITHWRPAAIAEPATAPANRPATTTKPTYMPAAAASAAATAKPAGPTSAMSPPATTPSGGPAPAAKGGTAVPASPAAKGVSHV